MIAEAKGDLCILSIFSLFSFLAVKDGPEGIEDRGGGDGAEGGTCALFDVLSEAGLVGYLDGAVDVLILSRDSDPGSSGHMRRVLIDFIYFLLHGIEGHELGPALDFSVDVLGDEIAVRYAVAVGVKGLEGVMNFTGG
jgi:hypothetical protein